MNFQDIIKKSIVEQFQGADGATGANIVLSLAVSVLIALYLFVVYRFFVRKSLYNINLNIAIVGMTVVTTAIILTIQSNLILSLGMVGALSIVRYRTAVKDPMDLFFLFWSVGNGVMCGARQYWLALMVTVVLTVVVFVLMHFPAVKAPYVLVVNGKKEGLEDNVTNLLEEYCSYYKVKSRNMDKEFERMVIEVRTKSDKDLVEQLGKIEGAKVSLLTYEGDIVG
ncbi:MAG: DUF4956 domain-containing protein [Lachnospiraceae bacterium]|nr:DUF4956 domain-containing protein [Lachnospiraceae bacterium]